MLLAVMFFEEVLAFEELLAMLALQRSQMLLTLLWDFDEVFVSGEGLLLHLVLFFQRRKLTVVSLNLLSDTLGGFNLVLILHV